MKLSTAAVLVVCAAVVAGICGFVGGARFADGHHRDLEMHSAAMRAGDMARALTEVGRGDREIAVRYLEDSLDTSLINAALLSPQNLAGVARNEVKLAAAYRTRHPGPNTNGGLAPEIQRAIELAK